MNRTQDRIDIKNKSIKRIRRMLFGDPVTNICAGSDNPIRHCYFVKIKKDNAQCTDKKGKFYDISIDVIYPGHLGEERCVMLFEPMWESEFGESK